MSPSRTSWSSALLGAAVPSVTSPCAVLGTASPLRTVRRPEQAGRPLRSPWRTRVARGQRRLRPRRAGGRELVEPRAPLVFGFPFLAAPFALPVALAVPLAEAAAPVDAPPAGRGLLVT